MLSPKYVNKGNQIFITQVVSKVRNAIENKTSAPLHLECHIWFLVKICLLFWPVNIC